MSCASLRKFPERKARCELFPTRRALWRFAGLFGSFETVCSEIYTVARGLRLNARIFGSHTLH